MIQTLSSSGTTGPLISSPRSTSGFSVLKYHTMQDTYRIMVAGSAACLLMTGSTVKDVVFKTMIPQHRLTFLQMATWVK